MSKNEAPAKQGIGRVELSEEAIAALLWAGERVTITATGRSMSPSIADGERVEIVPVGGDDDAGANVRPGAVVLALADRSPAKLLLHRVIARDGRRVVLAGDSALADDDAAFPLSRILGVAPAKAMLRGELRAHLSLRRRRRRWRDWLDGRRARLHGDDAAMLDWMAAIGAAWRRPEDDPPALPSEPPTAAGWRRLERERLAEATALLIADAAPHLDAPTSAGVREDVWGAAFDEVAARGAEILPRYLPIEATCAAVDGAFRAAEISAQVLRGPALARRWRYAEARTSSDLDFLVAPASVGAAIDALESLGFALEPRDRALWDNAGERAAEQTNRFHLEPAEGTPWVPVELHWAPLPDTGALRMFDLDSLTDAWTHRAGDAGAGLHEEPPSPEAAIVLAALHWTKHHCRPARELLDAAMLIGEIADDPAAWRRLFDLARRTNSERPVAAIVWLARGLFGAAVSPAALGAGAGMPLLSRREWMPLRWRFAASRYARRAGRGSSLLSRAIDLWLLAPRAPGRWSRVVRWYLWPSDAYLAETYGRADRPESTRIGGPLRWWHRVLFALRRR